MRIGEWRALAARLRSRTRGDAVLAAGPVVSSLSGWLYIAAGTALLVSSVLPSDEPDRNLVVVRGVNAFAVIAGIVMLTLRHRFGRWLPYLVTSGGVVLIALAVSASGGGVSAVAYACVFCLAPGYSYLMLPGRPATALTLFTLVIGVPTLARTGDVGLAEQVVVWSVAMMLAVVVGWMARALTQAETDTLTGLANRRGLERALQEAVTVTGGADRLAFVSLDIDHFKSFNEAQGRVAGDRLLVRAATAWKALVPPGSTLGRRGADEFGIVLPGMSAAHAGALTDALHAALSREATCSVGVAAREPGESASMLAARADGAVYSAKREGRARTHVHPGSGREGEAIREALGRREFVVHYQPIVDLRTGATLAAEALVRWQHPDGHLVPPLEFLGEAERSGAIVDLGRWILLEACSAAASWHPVDGVLPYVTVNASAQELQDPTYPAAVQHALVESGLPAHRLVLELVETRYDVESLQLVSTLHQLRTMGVRTAMDDFGVGYSSLDRLRRSGVDILKIDKSFTDDIVDAGDDAPLVSAIVAMARALGLRVVAEGVETEVQARWLRERGCECAQGWLFGRATPQLQTAKVFPQATLPSS